MTTKGSPEWMETANAALQKARPLPNPGEKATYDGGKFVYEYESDAWIFVDWIEHGIAEKLGKDHQ